MKRPLRTYLLVRAVLDDNEVPFLVADPSMPSRRVGIRRVANPPKEPLHFAEHFEPFAHVVDATNMLHLAHYRTEEKAGCLEILGQCQAQDQSEAMAKLAPEPSPVAKTTSPKPPVPAHADDVRSE
jgi:hypothetical protein